MEYRDAWPLIAMAIGGAPKQLTPSSVSQLLGHLDDPNYHEAWGSILDCLDEVASDLDSSAVVQLLGHLKDRDYRSRWGSVTVALGHALTHRGQTMAAQLLDCLADDGYHDAWDLLAAILGSAANYLGPSAVAQLLNCLEDSQYRPAWASIAEALGRAAALMDPSTIMPFLTRLENRQYCAAWEHIAMALAYAAKHLNPGSVAFLTRCLSNDSYRAAWASIALALGNAAKRRDSSATTLLLDCLKDKKYRAVWVLIAHGLCKGAANLDTPAVAQLLGHLKDEGYRSARGPIAHALGEAATYLGPSAVAPLLLYLTDETYRACWQSVAWALANASADLGVTAVPSLLDCLKREQYLNSAKWITRAVHNTAAHLDPAAVTQLLGHLGDNAYRSVWDEIASALGDAPKTPVIRRLMRSHLERAFEKGQRSYAHRIASAAPSLICFVRDVQAEAEPGLRIIWGVAERDDETLLLIARLAPADIQPLLNTEADSKLESVRVSAKDGGLEPAGIVRALLVALEFHKYAPMQRKKFEAELEQGTNRHTKIRLALNLIRDALPLGLQEHFVLEGTLKPSTGKHPNRKGASTRVKSETNGPSKGTRPKNSTLTINCATLIRVLFEPDQGRRLVERLFAAIVDKASQIERIEILVCKRCKLVHVLPDDRRRPRMCHTCDWQSPFGLNDPTKPLPQQLTTCLTCKDKPLFDIWPPHSSARAVACPRDGCPGDLVEAMHAGGTP